MVLGLVLARGQEHVGRILAGLAEFGLADDTIVVYTSEHGHLPGEHRLLNKNVLYAPPAQALLIVRRLRPPAVHRDLYARLLRWQCETEDTLALQEI